MISRLLHALGLRDEPSGGHCDAGRRVSPAENKLERAMASAEQTIRRAEQQTDQVKRETASWGQLLGRERAR